MPQNQDFGFELASRLEAVAQHANKRRPIAIMQIQALCGDFRV
jgi:hypothetical protein